VTSAAVSLEMLEAVFMEFGLQLDESDYWLMQNDCLYKAAFF